MKEKALEGQGRVCTDCATAQKATKQGHVAWKGLCVHINLIFLLLDLSLLFFFFS